MPKLMAFITLGILTVATYATGQTLLALIAGVPFITWGVSATSKKPSGDNR